MTASCPVADDYNLEVLLHTGPDFGCIHHQPKAPDAIRLTESDLWRRAELGEWEELEAAMKDDAE